MISDTLLGISKFGSISKIFLIKFNTVEYCKVTHKDDPPFLFIILSYNFNYLMSEKDHYHECDKTCTYPRKLCKYYQIIVFRNTKTKFFLDTINKLKQRLKKRK